MTEKVLRGRARQSESMGGQDERLTLQGLAKRLESLERENAELRQEVSALRGSRTRRDEVLALRGSDEHRDQEEPVSEFEGRVSRRSLLSKAGAAAVAAVAAGTLLSPRQAKADHWADGITEDFVTTHHLEAYADPLHFGFVAVEGHTTTSTRGDGAVEGHNDSTGPGVKGFGGTGVWGISSIREHSGVYGQHTGDSGYGVVGDGTGGSAGVLGRSSSDYGVQGEGLVGVLGQTTSTLGDGVEGVGKGSGSAGVVGRNFDSNGIGVLGLSGTGVRGESIESGSSGVLGRNPSGEGVRGVGRTGVSGVGTDLHQAGVKGEGPTGVWGLTSTRDFAGVYGEHTGTKGIGTVGIGKGDDTGVLGRNPTGQGLRGEGRYGVVAVGDSTGYGGRFEGGKAQLWLKPGASAGKPTSGTHKKGEIYMDSAGALFVCTAGDGTTIGTWKKVNMKLV